MPLPNYDDALERLLDGVLPLDEEVISLAAASDRILARAIVADRDQPPFNRAAMDGFALRSKDYQPGRTYGVVGSVPAGAIPQDFGAKAGEVIRIATGAAVPDAFDAVIQIELAEVIESDSRESVRFTAEAIAPGRNIHRRAADAALGQVLLQAPAPMTPQAIGLAAAVGAVNLTVTRQPRVVLLTTGDEVLSPNTPASRLADHQIRNSNGPMLRAILNRCGAELLRHEHLPDEQVPTRDAASRALEDADLIVTVGGVSAGQRDLLPGLWSELELKTILHGAAIQPGKPIFAARSQKSACLVLGLPGNPVSVLATAHLFLFPVIRRMLGLGPSWWRPIALAEAIQPNDRRELFRAAALTQEAAARVLPWHGSGDLAHTALAAGWVRLPMQEPSLQPGQIVPYLPMLT